MKAKSKSYSTSTPAARGGAVTKSYGGNSNDEGGRFQDRNLASVNPLTQQFEPTDSEPVRQRFKMAGGC